jgi:hypothetical protein
LRQRQAQWRPGISVRQPVEFVVDLEDRACPSIEILPIRSVWLKQHP